jgi:hypothetical protein
LFSASTNIVNRFPEILTVAPRSAEKLEEPLLGPQNFTHSHLQKYPGCVIFFDTTPILWPGEKQGSLLHPFGVLFFSIKQERVRA